MYYLFFFFFPTPIDNTVWSNTQESGMPNNTTALPFFVRKICKFAINQWINEWINTLSETKHLGNFGFLTYPLDSSTFLNLIIEYILADLSGYGAFAENFAAFGYHSSIRSTIEFTSLCMNYKSILTFISIKLSFDLQLDHPLFFIFRADFEFTGLFLFVYLLVCSFVYFSSTHSESFHWIRSFGSAHHQDSTLSAHWTKFAMFWTQIYFLPYILQIL